MPELPPLPSAASVVKMPYRALSLPSPYGEFFGKLPRDKQFSIFIYGENGTGKSSLSMRLAETLVRATGKNILYNGNEEPLETGSLTLRLKLLNIRDPRIKLLDTEDFNVLLSYLSTGDYAYCFIDSFNNLNIPQIEVLNMLQYYPNVSFVILGQVDKSGKHKGSEDWKHMLYAVYRTEKKDGVRTAYLEKSRYGATLRELEIFRE